MLILSYDYNFSFTRKKNYFSHEWLSTFWKRCRRDFGNGLLLLVREGSLLVIHWGSNLTLPFPTRGETLLMISIPSVYIMTRFMNWFVFINDTLLQMKNLKILINYRNLTKLCLCLWERYVVKKEKNLIFRFQFGFSHNLSISEKKKRFRRVIMSNFMNIRQILTCPPPPLSNKRFCILWFYSGDVQSKCLQRLVTINTKKQW